MNETTTTSNPLLRVRTEDLEQVLTARKTIKNIAQKYGLSPQPSVHQIVHRRNGSNGQHKPKMPQRIREKIAVGMKRRWAMRRKEAKSKETAPA